MFSDSAKPDPTQPTINWECKPNLDGEVVAAGTQHLIVVLQTPHAFGMLAYRPLQLYRFRRESQNLDPVVTRRAGVRVCVGYEGISGVAKVPHLDGVVHRPAHQLHVIELKARHPAVVSLKLAVRRLTRALDSIRADGG